MTFYRFEQTVQPHWDSVGSLSLCVVAQGRKRVQIGGIDYYYDPLHYLVMARGLRFQAEILEASPAKPFLSFVLQVAPEVVTEVLSVMNQQVLALFRTASLPPTPTTHVSPIDQNLVGAIHRFLPALDSDTDRKVLAPMYQREIVYRLLRAERCAHLVESAQQEAAANPVTAAIRFMKLESARPLTVRDVAEALSMSESAFAHLFKATTGLSPYQFLKQLRLEQARLLMLNEGHTVTEAATHVGYSSLSHFIHEFKRHFGETPRVYAERLREVTRLSLADTASG